MVCVWHGADVRRENRRPQQPDKRAESKLGEGLRDVSPKRTHEWPLSPWKDAHHPRLLGKRSSNARGRHPTPAGPLLARRGLEEEAGNLQTWCTGGDMERGSTGARLEDSVEGLGS